MTRFSPLAAAALAALAAGPAAAAGEHVSGTVTYISSHAHPVALAGGGRLLQVRSRGVLLDADPASPVNLSAQDCESTVVLGADKQPVMDSGSCVTVDKDGDTWTLWFLNRGDDRTWQVIGGTGKYAKMTGKGTTKVIGHAPDGREVLSYDGTLER